MASEFETILIPENINPTVKLEPFTTFEDDQNENSNCTGLPSAVEESKIGEIFYVTKEQFKFVCTHCFAEFPLLAPFTDHVQRHLHEIFTESFGIDIKRDSEMIEVKPLLFDCITEPLIDAIAQSDNDSIESRKNNKNQFKCADCVKCYDQPCFLRRHRAQKHATTHHPIDEIKSPATNESTIKLPTRQKNQLGFYECADCDQSFKLFVQLRRHRDLTHDGKKFCCELCGVKARYKKNMRRHMKFKHPQQSQNAFIETYDALDIVRIHTGKKFNCKICGVAASYRKNIRRHMKFKHPDQPQHLFMETFDVENDNEKRSRKKVPPNDNLVVNEVDDSFAEPQQNPIRIKKKFKCKKCCKTFKSHAVLREHQIVHAAELVAPKIEKDEAADATPSEKPYQCPICKLKYCFRKSFVKHLKIIHPENEIDLSTIVEQDSEAPSSTVLVKIEHVALTQNSDANDDATAADGHPPNKTVQTKAKKYVRIGHRHQISVCPICNLEFGNKWSLAWHNRNVHDPNGHTRESFECYACRTNFKSITDLRSHFRKKHYRIKYKPRPCTTCGQEFEDAFSFTKHRRWHKEQLIGRPHKCDVCGKTFVERFELGRHSQQHVTARDFRCEICDRAYRTLSDKNWHMRTHTGVGKLQCDECGKFLLDSEKLKRHMLTHTGESPFECEYCHKRFRQSYNLSIHKRSHTGEYIHYCTPCEKGFGARRELRKHNIRVHGIEMVENDVK